MRIGFQRGLVSCLFLYTSPFIRNISVRPFSAPTSPFMSSQPTVSTLESKLAKAPSSELSFINATVAKSIDEVLMETPGFSIDQLMELAGLSVAIAVDDFVSHHIPNRNEKILILCGPGNNGGDGLVAARHLWHFGYKPTIIYPKQNNGQLFINLVKQCHDLEIPILTGIEDCVNEVYVIKEKDDVISRFDPTLVVDSLFGFSFAGPPREPFHAMIKALSKTKVPTFSVDIPSGWDVNSGDIYSTDFKPNAVISLTAPKLCMQTFFGKHYLGGRFVPPSLVKSYDLKIPDYGKGSNQVVEIVHGENPQIEEGSLVAVMITASGMDEAKNIAKTLIGKKLAACVNILPSVLSIYEWNGKAEEDQETLMIVKSKESLLREMTDEVKRIHSYDVPETIAMKIIGGSDAYMNWVKEQTKR